MHDEIDISMTYLHNVIYKGIQNFLIIIVIIELPHIKRYLNCLSVCILCSFLFSVHYYLKNITDNCDQYYPQQCTYFSNPTTP